MSDAPTNNEAAPLAELPPTPNDMVIGVSQSIQRALFETFSVFADGYGAAQTALVMAIVANLVSAANVSDEALRDGAKDIGDTLSKAIEGAIAARAARFAASPDAPAPDADQGGEPSGEPEAAATAEAA